MVGIFKNNTCEFVFAALVPLNFLPAFCNMIEGGTELKELNKRVNEQKNEVLTSEAQGQTVKNITETKWKIVRGACELVPLAGIIAYGIIRKIASCCQARNNASLLAPVPNQEVKNQEVNNNGDINIRKSGEKKRVSESEPEEKEGVCVPQFVKIEGEENIIPEKLDNQEIEDDMVIWTIDTIPSPVALKKLDLNTQVVQAFDNVKSNEWTYLKGLNARDDFKKAVEDGSWPIKPLVLSKSEFVPERMAKHLMKNKKDSAIGVKYTNGKITNMEGALHSFLTPLCPITMTREPTYKLPPKPMLDLKGHGRNVILSAAIQPDFECSGKDEVVMKILEVKDQELKGKDLGDDFEPLWTQCGEDKESFKESLGEYELSLQKHMVYHLTSDHVLPALKDIQKGNIYPPNEAFALLNDLIMSNESSVVDALKGKYVVLNKHTLSLEAFFNFYLHQMRNEFSALESLVPHGYIYSIDPPAIFASQIGHDNVKLLNRLQILALKQLHQNTPLQNLKGVVFNDYADKDMTAQMNGKTVKVDAISLYKKVFPEIEIDIISKAEAFKIMSLYSIDSDYALVVHNNSDAFGQNIETEGDKHGGIGSMDAAIGVFSDAAWQLDRNRKDLGANII